MQCHKCGADLNHSDKFCFACGAQAGGNAPVAGLPSMQCKQCGAALKERDKFCGSCGVTALPAQSPPPVHDLRETRTHTLAIFLGYLLLYAGVHALIAGFILNIEFIGRYDIGIPLIRYGSLCLVISMFVSGLYLWSRKHRSSRYHGRVIFFLSLIALVARVVYPLATTGLMYC